MDDRQIVALFLQRDEQALRETARKYGNYCLAIASNILGNREDAEECVNDAYLGVWNAIPPHEPEALSAFLGKITRRLSLKKLRERQADKRGGGQIPVPIEELEECLPDTENPAADGVITEVLDRFLASLPETERRIFVCRYWYFDSVREIAERFGYGESRVKMILKRERDKLSQELKKEKNR